MKPSALCFILFVPLVLLSVPLAAQENQTGSDYRIGGDGKIRQRLNWERVNAYYFEIEIQRQDGTNWVPEFSKRTDGLFIEVSLSPGMYRYRIHSYNVLDKIAASSEWTGLRVFAAKRPSAQSFDPASFHYDGGETEFILTLRGADLVDGASVRLVSRTGESPEPLSLWYSLDETELKALFPATDLRPGPYNIVITNPGGLTQTIEGFAVDFTRKRDITISLGYAAVLPLGGYLFVENAFSGALYPRGLYARLGYIPVKKAWGALGAELNSSWNLLNTGGGAYPVSGFLLAMNLNGLYQRWFRDWTMAFTARMGAGLAGFTMEYDNGGSEAKNGTGLFSVNAGVSLVWLVWNGMFIETGVEYIQCFSSIRPAPRLVRMTAGAGWKL
jgi:hypothetical protein